MSTSGRPPDSAIDPPAVKAFPSIAGYRPLSAKTGAWPQDSEVTVRVPADRTIGTDALCAGALASRLSYTVLIHGRDAGIRSSCAVWNKGSFPMAIRLHKIPAGKNARITIRWSISGPTGNRPVR
ncbi:hypothetical protein [Sinosporangium siamense]|uniref:Uncharacterized protein n=1 Tax=Sinosporangium siamense TaxID=1367973 RepID=A0A919RHR1_9ACTN|nr:hypothetical protein [Sinosporangium siamense]GII92186.1 hypothetical protein Ssi02_24170 [Sinosporangium siamense]